MEGGSRGYPNSSLIPEGGDGAGWDGGGGMEEGGEKEATWLSQTELMFSLARAEIPLKVSAWEDSSCAGCCISPSVQAEKELKIIRGMCACHASGGCLMVFGGVSSRR